MKSLLTIFVAAVAVWAIIAIVFWLIQGGGMLALIIVLLIVSVLWAGLDDQATERELSNPQDKE